MTPTPNCSSLARKVPQHLLHQLPAHHCLAFFHLAFQRPLPAPCKHYLAFLLCLVTAPHCAVTLFEEVP